MSEKQSDQIRKRPSSGAMRAAKKFLHPLAGDYLQEAQVKELARIIDEEIKPVGLVSCIDYLLGIIASGKGDIADEWWDKLEVACNRVLNLECGEISPYVIEKRPDGWYWNLRELVNDEEQWTGPFSSHKRAVVHINSLA